ncbi:hypothetical protein [Acinetobacter bereziniae]|uniref:hypothetical protein n=1 Tax=Acinetobacter bereziniae TaxID=106648 RepID=UPI0018FF4B6F|nr:hypothetical protein [Acinetobacter bereziniae]MBJ9901229.1 hypothetical protein [Acinetobacter bereziniae]MCU4319221.1 hypothetical protein [Acinetobacter bereziniae]MCU4597319.1 hypothetical protein [Acinetobacter bereziniae]
MKKYEMKKSDLDALGQKVKLKNGLNQFKAGTVSASITALICASIPAFAADLEIYKIPEDSTGTATLMLMLDTSGSMARNMENNNSASTGYSRLEILKKGLREVLGGTPTSPPVEDKIVMGLSDFSGDTGRILLPAKALGSEVGGTVNRQIQRWYRIGTSTNSYRYATCTENYPAGGCKVWGGISTNNTNPGTSAASGNYGTNSCDFGSNCVVYYTTISKTRTHRDDMFLSINDLQSGGGTPTPYAYAEAAAYLMGTTTRSYIQSSRPGFARYNSSSGWKCNDWNSSGACIDWGNYITSTVPTGSISNSPCTVRYSGQNYNATCYYYNPVEKNSIYSGFTTSANVSGVTSNNLYVQPASISSQLGSSESAKAKKECSGQGIYFLTDGEPEPGGVPPDSTGKTGTAYGLMSTALSNKGNLFSCANSQLGKRSNYKNSNNAWSCIGNYAQALLDPEKNPLGLKIKTAVVGFSSSFSSDTNSDVQDAKDWGTIGGGKWYVGTNSQSVVDSINNFIDEISKDIPSMSTGSSTVPMDALNPEIIQKYAYFPQFEPKVDPADTRQLWFGNLKKYHVVNNGVYADAAGTASQAVVLRSKLQDLTDIWAKSGVTYAENTPVFQKGGVLSQLPLGTVTTTNDKGDSITTAGRKLLTNYVYDGSKAEADRISQDFDLQRIDYTYTTDVKTKTDNAARVRGLMTLLGYNISSSTETNGLNLTNATANVRQMGSVYHSLPVLLTQEGKAVATRNATTNKVEISSVDRKDYVMFGTTQGLLSIVDTTTGIEKFSFVPKEMIENQSETFRENAGNLAGGKSALYYGIDGEWVAHTVYVTKSDGTLTVNGAVRGVIGGSKDDVENLKGKQWVYGGLRMGGRSYYSLDLTDIDTPKLKFHIDPTTGKVYSKGNSSGKAYKAIENMAQSWSKPKLDYVNWKGQRKLVMFVGGGYDAGGDKGDGSFANGIRTGYAGYEHYNYVQDNKKGSGVYMFDADNGDLLWYADSSTKTADTGVEHSTNASLKYSVASDIKTVDRDNDGIVDHIYFGDLAGQAFRVDFKNDGNKESFNSQVSQILNLHETNGTSPRFYMAPVFTAHHSAGKREGANIIVVSFVSGNKSSPLLATTDSPTSTGKTDPLGLQYDAVYAVYDYDIHPDGTFYPQQHIAARTRADETATEASTTKLKYIGDDHLVRSDSDTVLVKGAQANANSGWGGWYYPFKKKFNATLTNREDAGASIIKGLTPLIAMEGSLYVTQYDASNNGTSSSCGAGVKGHSFTQRLCLPTGVCPQNANYVYNLGAGIVNLNVGPSDDSGKKSIIVPDPADIGVGCVGAACQSGTKFITAGGSIRFIPNRWYERYAKAE